MGEPDRGAGASRALGSSELAWVALIPCAIVAVAAIILLGPPVGRAFFAPGTDALWPPGWWGTESHPEPVKQGRYVLAVFAPLLLVGALLAGARRDVRLSERTLRVIVWAGYAALAALVAAALLNQHVVINPGVEAPALFGAVEVVVAAALVLGALLALRRPAVSARVAALGRETRGKRHACLAVAIAFAAIWLLRGVMTDRLTADVGGLNFAWTLNDALAVLNGRTPLVDYHAFYAKLLPYPTALVVATFGDSILVYTLFTALLNGLTLLAVYAVFRLLTRSSLLALGLLLPFVATSDLGAIPIAAGVVSPMTLPAMWPMRFGGVFLLAWLVARHVAGRRPQRVWTIFLVGGLVTINTLEFGLGALAATVAALLCARPPRSLAELRRLAGQAAAGLLAALAIVVVGTLGRAGEPPDLGQLLEWPRIFSRLGLLALPLPLWGLHLAVYATFVAAIAVAVVRMLRDADDVLLTSMLAWSGVFGLLAGSYFVGRPDLLKLTGILAAWSFALAPLMLACVRTLAARDWRRPTVPQLLVLFGFALSVCSLATLSPPQDEIARLTRAQPDPVYEAAMRRFVGDRTEPGETVAILVPMADRIAEDLGLRNVAPYPLMNAIVTAEQMERLVRTVRREHVEKIFMPTPGSRLVSEGDAAPEHLQVLAGIGFEPTAPTLGVIELRRARGAGP
jgi:branched-subunit amino acid transport protein